MTKWKLSLVINKNSEIAIYRQIASSIISGIETGRLASGTPLPGTRTLATELGVNRNTVVQAYEELLAQGWIEYKQGKPPYVSVSIPSLKKLAKPEISTNSVIYQPASKILKISDGYPDSRLFPLEIFSRTFGRIGRLYGHRLYSSDLEIQGSMNLRSSISEMLKLRRNLKFHAQDLIITRGSQQAIFMIAVALKKLGGHSIAVESPGYAPAARAFIETGFEVIKVPVDKEGLDVENLERKLSKGSRITALYTTPHHQYPTTVTLKANRRVKLLELAEKYNFWIIEDDYDHDFHYEGSPVFPLSSLSSSRVIYLSSLSKVLSIGLRLGYIVAPSKLIKPILNVKSLMDRIGDPLLERAIHELIEDGELQRHINKMRKIYKTRRDLLFNLLHDYIPELGKPSGGMALWIPVPCAYTELISALGTDGIQPVNPSQLTLSGGPAGTRIGFADLNENEMHLLSNSLRRIYR